MPIDLRFVLVGTGNISGTYAAAIAKTPGMRVVGYVSRSGRRPAFVPEGAGVAVATRLEEVSVPFDAVVVATPNGLHHEGAIAAARLGKHVLTEKPLDVTAAAMDAMIAACDEAGVRLAVAYQRRMSPDNRALKRLVEAGALGRVYAADVYVKFFREAAYYESAAYRGSWAFDGGGALMMQASHQVDLYTWLFGMPDEVHAVLGTLGHDVEVEDHAAAVLRHAGGMIGTIVASTVARPGFPARLEVHAEWGSVVLENDVITRWAVDGLPNPSTPPVGAIHSGASVAVTDTAGHEAILADFAEAVREDREPAVSADSARLATELVLRIYAPAVAR